jgi:hypothetical protein
MHESEAYTSFIFERVAEAKARKGALPIMFTIRGETDIPELELTHLDGYRSSQPVRIGNGAAFHVQLDIYGELMDGIYLANKFGKPTSYDQWLSVREITDYVCSIWTETDMSIWEVRGQKQNFVYSKIMMWVAIDRALRLSEKRCFPCPNRWEWLRVRDEICEEVMEKGYNQELKSFIQSYEANEILDSSILIAPLVFFIAPTDPRFLSTLDRILKAPEKGGLTSTGLVYRYNSAQSDDGKLEYFPRLSHPNSHSLLMSRGATPHCNTVVVSGHSRSSRCYPCFLRVCKRVADSSLGVGGREGAFSMVCVHVTVSQKVSSFAGRRYCCPRQHLTCLCKSFANFPFLPPVYLLASRSADKGTTCLPFHTFHLLLIAHRPARMTPSTSIRQSASLRTS